MSTLAHLTIQNFTGSSFDVNVDLVTTTVYELKQTIITIGKGKSVREPVIAYKGHVLRDDRSLDYYDLQLEDTIHVVPRTQVTKLYLRLAGDEEETFDLDVGTNITIGQLKRDIALEEKVDVTNLKARFYDEGDLETLDDEFAISNFPLESPVIEVSISDRSEIKAGKQPSTNSFTMLLSIDERKNEVLKPKDFLPFVVMPQQTLAEFEADVAQKLSKNLTNYTLILDGREMKADTFTLEDLGFVSGCTLHAVADIQICIPTPNKDFDMSVSPMTNLLTIRGTLEKIDDKTPWDDYAFSLDGMSRLIEIDTMWDLDLKSPTMLYLVKRFLSLTVRLRGGPEDKLLGPEYEVEAQEDELVEGLKQRIFLESEIPPGDQLLFLHERLLQDHLTLREERVDGKDDLDVINTELLGNISLS